MAKIYSSVIDLIGGTPLVEVKNLEREEKLEATLLVKLEYRNPAGSAKDRIAKSMIEDAEEPSPSGRPRKVCRISVCCSLWLRLWGSPSLN